MTILEMTEFVFITFFQLGKTVMAFTSLNTASRYVGSVSDQIDTNFPYPSFSSASSERPRNLGLANQSGSQTAAVVVLQMCLQCSEDLKYID